MKIFNRVPILTTLLLFLSIYTQAKTNFSTPVQLDSAFGSEKDFSKNYNKTFTVTNEQLVVLANKYGKIDVKTGNSNQVVVNVKVTAKANSQTEADKTFDRINIAFSEGPTFVKTETNIENASGWNIWGNDKSDFQIDYDVTMPAQNMLDLSNKYGNSHVAPLSNWVKIEQKYGDFRLDGAAKTTIELAYGGGTLGSVNALNGSVSYGKLSVSALKDVALKTKYSEFRFEKVENLSLQSSYDDYKINDVANLAIDSKYGDMTIGSVENLAIKSAYTDLKIKMIEKSADFQTSYGNVQINGLKNGFNDIIIKSSYTDFTIDVDPSVSYWLDMIGSYSDINKPVSFNYKVDSENGSKREVMGYVGSQTAKSMIKARMTYGDLKLK